MSDICRDRKDFFEGVKERKDGRVKFEEAYREDLKEYSCESIFKDRFDCDFGKNLEFWERYYFVREKEKRDGFEKEKREKIKLEKYRDKFSDKDKNEKFFFEKC